MLTYGIPRSTLSDHLCGVSSKRYGGGSTEKIYTHVGQRVIQQVLSLVCPTQVGWKRLIFGVV